MIHQLSCAGKTEKVSFILSELAESHIISTQHRIIILQIVILKQDWGYCPVNGAGFWGLFLTGVYLPQKSELAPPLDREGMLVQKYVPSFLTKFNPIWFK
jgi:hypothetical protein